MSSQVQTNPVQITFDQRMHRYADILNDLFDATRYNESHRLFEFVCTLVRAGGVQGPGWDPWVESEALLEDLKSLMRVAHTAGNLADPDRTEMRLALLSYCHITEVDLTYSLLANLLRVRLGQKYDLSPFADLYVAIGKKKPGFMQKIKPPSPGKKIKRIQELAEAAQLPEVGKALVEIYNPIIRNAIYHSDYALYGNALHLFSDYHLSQKKRYYTREVEYEELEELISNAFAFYSAVFGLYDRCRRSFGDFKDAFLPFDLRYKGLMEFLFDGEMISGFRTYWPNGSQSTYNRTKNGNSAVNVMFNADRSVNFQVNLYASKPGAFSPLVEHDAQPVYSPRPGTNITPHWPDDLHVYKIAADGTVSTPV